MCEDRTPSEQFVSDFLMVTENDQKTYNKFKALLKDKGTIKGAEYIQEDFETWVSDLAEELQGKNEIGALLLRQMLIGWGFDAFYKIARRFEQEV